MCERIHELDEPRKVSGYKVAMRHIRTGKIYSAAIGCEYKKGKVPKPRKQRRLTTTFVNGLLDMLDELWNHRNQFKKAMYGMTAVFPKLPYVKVMARSMSYDYYPKEYELVIIRLTIFAISAGTYNGKKVFLGKEIMEDPKVVKTEERKSDFMPTREDLKYDLTYA